MDFSLCEKMRWMQTSQRSQSSCFKPVTCSSHQQGIHMTCLAHHQSFCMLSHAQCTCMYTCISCFLSVPSLFWPLLLCTRKYVTANTNRSCSLFLITVSQTSVVPRLLASTTSASSSLRPPLKATTTTSSLSGKSSLYTHKRHCD